MTLISDIPNGQCVWIVPPRIHAMMTGVQTVRIFGDGRIELTYTDCTRESAKCARHDEDVPGYIDCIERVQGCRMSGR